MPQKTTHYYIKYQNVAFVLAILLLILVGITSGCQAKSDKKPAKNESSAVDASSLSEPKLFSNFKYVTVKNDTAVHNGVLTVIDKNNPYTGNTPDNLESVYNYLFNSKDEQVCLATSSDVKGNPTMLKAFNSMIVDFNKETNIDNVIVNSMYVEKTKDNADDLYEHQTGNAFDLNIYDEDNGTYPSLTAEGDYTWFSKNCYKYGFVQRYTEDKAAVTGVTARDDYFRYVGKVNAKIMNDNKLCLEEYIKFIKDYSFDKPLECVCEDNSSYAVYYVSSEKGSETRIPVPLNDDNSPYKYSYSGNNSDGYIVWVKLADNAAPASSSTADSSIADSTASSSTAESSSQSNAEESSDIDSTSLDSSSDTGSFYEVDSGKDESKSLDYLSVGSYIEGTSRTDPAPEPNEQTNQ
ncbi:MAG: D-alanyl-D-alanine carboxypeptidase family protein [Oscillospiraceae bacterium]